MINILIGGLAGLIGCFIFSRILRRSKINYIFIIIFVLGMLQLSNFFIVPRYDAWKTINEIKNNSYFSIIEKTDPILFDQFIKKVEKNILAHGKPNNIFIYTAELQETVLPKYFPKSSNEAIFKFAKATLKWYEELYKLEPELIITIELKNNKITNLPKIEPKLLRELQISLEEVIISAISNPYGNRVSYNDFEERFQSLLQQLVKKYGKDLIYQIFTKPESINSSSDKDIIAKIIIDFYKYLIATGEENTGIIYRSFYLPKDAFNDNKQMEVSAKDIYNEVKNSIYTVYGRSYNKKLESLGGAVAITEKLLSTNCHVILNNDHFVVEINEDTKPGKLFSQRGDLCLIEVPGEKFKPVQVRPSKEVAIGENVYAVGNPGGLNKTISKGIISNKYSTSDGFTVLQTDAAISGGSSGGGLFDNNGNLIGITSSGIPSAENIGFVIPTEMIELAISQPKKEIIEKSYSEKSKNIRGSSNTNNTKIPHLQLIDYYGENKIGLFKMENNKCFIAIRGRDENEKENSLVIWQPSYPETFWVFPFTASVTNAITILHKFSILNENLKLSKSFLAIDNVMYELEGSKHVKGAFPILTTVIDKNPSKNFINGDFFIGQFKSPETPEGYRKIWYGLWGFSEALAAYHTYSYCEK